ncbi:MAG: tyrosine-type recombinase/integrase [Puniceicoccales bacterium]
MAKPIQIPIKKRGDRYQLDVPPHLSPSGKRWRPSYETDEEAKNKRSALMKKNRQYGTAAINMPADLAADARKALEVLKPYGATLLDAAKAYAKKRAQDDESVTFTALHGEYLKTKDTASARYAASIERVFAKVLPKLGPILVADLRPIDLERELESNFKTAVQFNFAYRTIRPAFSLAVQRGYCKDNPFDRIAKRKQAKKDIEVLTVEESRAVLAACRDFTEDQTLPAEMRLDCRDMLPAVALMLFAGVRPSEVQRIDWKEVAFDHETVRIPPTKAKTRSARFIPMEDALLDWLKPYEGSEGTVAPERWNDRWRTVRRIAGISDKQDVLRHTFASYHLAAHADVKALRESMGHETPEMLFTHYRALVRKQDAVKFWSIRPDGEEAKLKEVSA